ncbi:hypothetical protein [Dactylosporangium sp. NPDC000521]|uniref:hypothetical protein n=1 Tax=Dactylosporangium sp. NPDC000521 TaxID=3363975 RepID=UPI0036CF00C5
MIDLAARFARLAAEHEHRRSAAHDRVVHWDWYTWPGLDPRPLHFERDLLRPGRRLDARPPLNQSVLRIGFDAEGRVAVTDEHSGFLRGRRTSETFTHHDGDVVESAHFDNGGRPVFLHEYRFVDGLMRSADMVTRHGHERETYEYTDGRVTRVEISHNGRPRARLAAEHDADGLVRIVEAAHLRKPAEVRYERPPAGFDLAVACRTIEDALVAAIPPTVARLPLDGAADCVALSYFLAETLNIVVHAATADERAALAATYDADAAWSAEDFEANTPVDTDIDGIRMVRQELALRNADDPGSGTELARRLLCAVAARLNHRDWSDTLPVTDDFVVYPVDLELEYLHQNLTDCVPPARLAHLRERLRLGGTTVD